MKIRFVAVATVSALLFAGAPADAQDARADIYLSVADAAAAKFNAEFVRIANTLMDESTDPSRALLARAMDPAAQQALTTRGHHITNLETVVTCPPDEPARRCTLMEGVERVLKFGPISDNPEGGKQVVVEVMEASGAARQPIDYVTWIVPVTEDGDSLKVGEWRLYKIT